jgi:methyltransferase (TIGR00027 family)
MVMRRRFAAARRASLTASAVAALRALASSAPLTLVDPEDDVAARLLPWPLRTLLAPVLATRAGRGALGPAIAGASLGLADHVALRSAILDQKLRGAIAAGCAQVVIIGAGLDSRAHRLPALQAARVFEVDRAATQRKKRERARDLPVLARALRYVSADLARDSLTKRLADSGFAADAPSVFIVEGVLPYLPEPARHALLAELARCAAPSSRLLLTYVPPDLPLLRYGAALVYPALWAIGEPMVGVVRRAVLERELAETGFTVESDTDTKDWALQLNPRSKREPFTVYERLVAARKA